MCKEETTEMAWGNSSDGIDEGEFSRRDLQASGMEALNSWKGMEEATEKGK